MADKWERLHDAAVNDLIDYFEHPAKQTEDRSRRARIASGVLATYARLTQAEGASNALVYAMQRDGIVGPRAKKLRSG